jgi:hypothetical protein
VTAIQTLVMAGMLIIGNNTDAHTSAAVALPSAVAARRAMSSESEWFGRERLER